MVANHTDVRISGPILPEAGNVYRVNYNNGTTSNPASLRVCIEVCKGFNKRRRGNSAFVEYVSNVTNKSEATNNGKT